MNTHSETTRGQPRPWLRTVSTAPVPFVLALVFLGLAAPAREGKLSWLDDIVREVIAERSEIGQQDAGSRQ